MQDHWEELLARRIDNPKGLWPLATKIKDLMLVTYEVNLERASEALARQPVAIIPFETQDDARALLSIVTFRYEAVYFCGAPILRHSFFQTNYRLYVTDPVHNDPQVFFLATSASKGLHVLAQLLWKANWHHGDYRGTTLEPQGDLHQVSCHSKIGDLSLTLRDNHKAPEKLPYFSSIVEQEVILAQPVQGSFQRRDGATGAYRIWHPRLALSDASVLKAKSEYLERSGLIQTDQKPAAAFIAREALFKVQSPTDWLRCGSNGFRFSYSPS